MGSGWMPVNVDLPFAAKGCPEEGIAPCTRWEDIPDNWNCPSCSVSKGDFEMVAI